MRTPGGRVRALVVNPVVRTLLRSPAHRLLSGSLLLLDYTGRRSGRRYVLPVAYAAAGDDLVVVIVQPTTKTWWRNFDGAPQEPLVPWHGRAVRATAQILRSGDIEDVRADRRRPSPGSCTTIATTGQCATPGLLRRCRR